MFDEWGDYGNYEGAASSPTSTDSGFFASAMAKVDSALTSVKSFSETPVGSQLFNAIYQYGAGRVDQAREKLVNAFLMTSEGQKIQQEATRQTAVQYAPLIALAVGAIFLLALMVRR